MDQVSDCCGAQADVSAADEGTGCWMCRACGQPCDARSASIAEVVRDFLAADLDCPVTAGPLET